MSLKSTEVLKFLRFNAAEATSATFKEIAVATGLSIRSPYVMLVKALQLEILSPQVEWPAQNAIEKIMIQFTRESKTAMLEYDDADLMEKYTREFRRVATIGTDAGPAYDMVNNPITIMYSNPIVYAGANLFIGILSTFSSGLANIRGRIGYTTVKVSERDFYTLASSF